MKNAMQESGCEAESIEFGYGFWSHFLAVFFFKFSKMADFGVMESKKRVSCNYSG